MVSSDYSAGHLAHTLARHQRYSSSSQALAYPWSSRPKVTGSSPAIPLGRRRQSLTFLSTPSPRRRTFLVFRCALLFRDFWSPYRPNPRPRTSPCPRCARLRKSSWLLSTPRIKILMIPLPRIFSVLHVISSKCNSMAAMCSQGYSRSITYRTSSFNCCHQTATGPLTTH